MRSVTYDVMSAPPGLHALGSRLMRAPFWAERTEQSPLGLEGMIGLTLLKKRTASDLLGSPEFTQ